MILKTIILSIIFVLTIIIIYNNIDFVLNVDLKNIPIITTVFEDESLNFDKTIEALSNLSKNQIMVSYQTLWKVFVLVIADILFISIPIYLIAYIKMYKKDHTNLKRTKEGNRMLEQFNALKNFIHDFTLLSERKKEEIILWEDFLTYAVLLEENQEIVKDLLQNKPKLIFEVLSNNNPLK